jgi:hypothetical protein
VVVIEEPRIVEPQPVFVQQDPAVNIVIPLR